MDVKLFEIRDEGTFIPVLTVRFLARSDTERWLLSRAGYGLDVATQNSYILLWNLNGGTNPGSTDPYEHSKARTLQVAHEYINKNWFQLLTGQVIDVEYILGESATPKRSDRFFGGKVEA